MEIPFKIVPGQAGKQNVCWVVGWQLEEYAVAAAKETRQTLCSCSSYFFAIGMDMFDVDVHIGWPRVGAYECVYGFVKYI